MGVLMMWSGVAGVLYDAVHGISCMSAFALLTLIGIVIELKEARAR